MEELKGVVEIGCVVGMGALGANEASSIYGTIVDIVGMTFADVVEISLFFN